MRSPVQLVLPSNCVVDLTRLARELGRELRPLDAEGNQTPSSATAKGFHATSAQSG